LQIFGEDVLQVLPLNELTTCYETSCKI